MRGTTWVSTGEARLTNEVPATPPPGPGAVAVVARLNRSLCSHALTFPNYPIPCPTPECARLAVRRVVITLTQSKLAELQAAGRTPERLGRVGRRRVRPLVRYHSRALTLPKVLPDDFVVSSMSRSSLSSVDHEAGLAALRCWPWSQDAVATATVATAARRCPSGSGWIRRSPSPRPSAATGCTSTSSSWSSRNPMTAPPTARAHLR